MYIRVCGMGGGLTYGGGHVVSGQYHHGPASPNIIWVLNCIFVSGLDTERERKEGKKADGVCGRDFKGWGKKTKADDGLRERQGETANLMPPLASSGVFGFPAVSFP